MADSLHGAAIYHNLYSYTVYRTGEPIHGEVKVFCVLQLLNFPCQGTFNCPLTAGAIDIGVYLH